MHTKNHNILFWKGKCIAESEVIIVEMKKKKKFPISKTQNGNIERKNHQFPTYMCTPNPHMEMSAHISMLYRAYAYEYKYVNIFAFLFMAE